MRPLQRRQPADQIEKPIATPLRRRAQRNVALDRSNVSQAMSVQENRLVKSINQRLSRAIRYEGAEVDLSSPTLQLPVACQHPLERTTAHLQDAM